MSTAIMKKTRGNGVNMKSPGIASTNTALTADGKREILRRGQNIGPKVIRGHGIMRATLPRMTKSGCLNEQRTGSDKLIHIEKRFDCRVYQGGVPRDLRYQFFRYRYNTDTVWGQKLDTDTDTDTLQF